MTAGYSDLARIKPARRLIYALSAACLSYGMINLTVLLSVQRATHSYPTGGLAVAAFALAAGVSAPFRARLVDRRGRHWLQRMTVAFLGALAALDVAAHLTSAGWLLIVLSGLIGVLTAPLFASAVSIWPLAVEEDLLRRGLAVTSLLADLGQVAGPVFAGLLFLASGWLAPLVSGTLAVVAGGLSVPDAGHPAIDVRPAPMPSLREGRALLVLLAISVVVGGSVGLVQVTVPTVAGLRHEGSLAGPLLGAFAAGSVVGAIWFGSRAWRRDVVHRYLVAVLAQGLLVIPLCFVATLGPIAVLLFIAGLAYGPATISIFEALPTLAPGSGAEALAWVTTAEASGSALGSAVASPLVLHLAHWSPYAIAAVMLTVPAAAALAARGARPAAAVPS